MKTLTVFTPTYNRKHTLPRTYESLCRQTCTDFDWLIVDDGSRDGTREWVESLGPKSIVSSRNFDWMGRAMSEELGASSEVYAAVDHFVIQSPNFSIEYVYKPNGGLYTGYNVAYHIIQTELCVCIDSDDFMPDDAVEKIVEKWRELSVAEKQKYCGINGLDFNVVGEKPIGGKFPEGLTSGYFMDFQHGGDTKQVMRTALMKEVAPQLGYKGERDFNPFYMLVQVLDKFPILFVNENYCWVEYQIGGDSMSAGIWKQYRRSPRSYAKYRINEMKLKHGFSSIGKLKSCSHYISSCILAKDKDWLANTPLKLLTVLAIPMGIIETLFILWKTRK